MLDKKISTGDRQFDKDIEELFDICKGDKNQRLVNICKAIEDKDISQEDFASVVPESLIRLGFALTGSAYEIILDKVQDSSRILVKKAKELFEKHFSKLYEHPVAKSLASSVMGESGERETLQKNTCNTISGMTYMFTWNSTPPGLIPSVRIGFRDMRGKIILDSLADWEELSYIIESLTELLSELMNRSKSLAELEQIDLSDSRKVGERIAKTKEYLKKIEALAPTYKIKIESGGESEKVQKTKKKKRRD